jgi:hypothetical protein
VARGNIERYTLDMWKVNLLFLSALMYAQKPTGTIFGQTWPNNIPGRPVSLLVFSSETAIKPIYAEVAADGKFQIVGLSPGWHVLYAQPDGCRGIVKAVRNVPGKQTFASDMFDTCECWSHTNKDWLCEPPMFRPQTAADIRASRIPAAIPVVTVCEALQSQLKLNSESVVIVGILTSGNNATLRQDCPNHPVTDEIAWPSAISVVGATPAPKGMRRQVEKKRSLVLATGSRESSIPAERVVGLYGRFVIPEGFATADSAATNRLHEMAMAPAALFGSAELHFRAISVDAAKTR